MKISLKFRKKSIIKDEKNEFMEFACVPSLSPTFFPWNIPQFGKSYQQ
jgi:hypothetical protein